MQCMVWNLSLDILMHSRSHAGLLRIAYTSKYSSVGNCTFRVGNCTAPIPRPEQLPVVRASSVTWYVRWNSVEPMMAVEFKLLRQLAHPVL
jgi:hypothetical protein